MDDEEFTELVSQDDSATLACFARSEQMKPHHLAYIEYKLAAHPHRQELLATSYDTSITLKKALECQGDSREMTLFRQARANVESNDDPRIVWQAYLELSTSRPVRTSIVGSKSIH
jgi:hypothetical protein